jgi:hypothetical protein
MGGRNGRRRKGEWRGLLLSLPSTSKQHKTTKQEHMGRTS